MIKAPLDEKNISPTTIIDDLTNCDNIGKDCTAVGYMYHTPVLFEYSGNVMRITFRKSYDLEKHKSTIRNYVKDMKDTDKLRSVILEYLTNVEIHSNIIARFYTNTHSFKLMFWWKEDEEN